MNDKRLPLPVSDGVLLKGKLWFGSEIFFGLFCFDIENGNVNVFRLPEVRRNENYRYFFIYHFDNKLMLLPRGYKEIICFNLDTHIFEMVFSDNNESSGYNGAILVGEQIFVYGPDASVLIFDRSLRFKTKINFNDSEELGFPFVRKQIISLDGDIYFPCARKPMVLVFDTKSEDYHTVSFQEYDVKGFSGIACEDEQIVLSPNGYGCLIKWLYKKNHVLDLKCNIKNSIDNSKSFDGVITIHNDVWLAPIIPIKDTFLECENVHILNGVYSFFKYGDCGIYAFNLISKSLELYKEDGKLSEQFYISIPKRVLEMADYNKLSDSVKREDIYFELQDYLNCI